MYISIYTLGRCTHYVQVDYVLGNPYPVLKRFSIGWLQVCLPYTVASGMTKGNFKVFVMLLATNKVDLERLAGACFKNLQCVTKLQNDGARSFGKFNVDMCCMDIFLSASTSCRIRNTQWMGDDQHIQIVHVAICFDYFQSSCAYLIRYQTQDYRAH